MEFFAELQNITLQDVLLLLAFVLIYPIYWVVVYKLMDQLFD